MTRDIFRKHGGWSGTGFAALLFFGFLCLPALAQTQYEIGGNAIETVDNMGVLEDGVYVAFGPLPDQDVLMIPYYFEGNSDATQLIVSFNDEPREIAFGLPLLPDAIDFLFVDIADVRGQTGAIRITLSSTGTQTALFMLIDAIETSGPDTDEDGVADALDNCIEAGNADQRDTDADGIGNACDADLNNDCIVNAADLGAFKPVFFSGDPDADFDGDGVVNVIDLGILKSRFFASPGPSGVPNACGGG